MSKDPGNSVFGSDTKLFLAIDLRRSGINFALSEHNPPLASGLPLDEMPLPLSAERNYQRLNGAPLACLNAVLAAAKDLAAPEKTFIQFGALRDPFQPFEHRFSAALNILETLATEAYQHVAIQTRSPLVVCAAPILRTFRERLSVTIAVETASDSLSRRLMPALPRPTERFKVARAISACGLTTILRVTPIVPRQSPQSRLSALAAAIQATGCPVQLTPIRNVLPDVAPGSDLPSSLLSRLRLLENAHLALERELRSNFPSVRILAVGGVESRLIAAEAA